MCVQSEGGGDCSNAAPKNKKEARRCIITAVTIMTSRQIETLEAENEEHLEKIAGLEEAVQEHTQRIEEMKAG